MILTKEQVKEFEEKAKPMIEFLNSLGDPYAKATIEVDGADLHFSTVRIKCDDYIKD